MRPPRVIVIGAGIGGLTAALTLAGRGAEVIVVERAAAPGGKLRPVRIGAALLDAGPTVFTMRWVFEEIFAAAGSSLAAHVTLSPASTLARHAWGPEERLDLFADIDRSADAIGAFAGASEARGYRAFCARARRIYATLEHSFIRADRPTPVGLIRQAGLGGLADLWRISPFQSMARALRDAFRDPRLRQLFGRYATYCGSSPYLAPATLMLVAHVEQAGVWLVQGGMRRLAGALADLAAANGAVLRYGAHVARISFRQGRASGVVLSTGEVLEADAVIANADVAALAEGRFGTEAADAVPRQPASRRSLSAITWTMRAPIEGFPLIRHNVFFSPDPADEFRSLFRDRRLPEAPTVYVCAEDRDEAGLAPEGPERLLCLINAPAIGDVRPLSEMEIKQCTERSFARLARSGLVIDRQAETTRISTPADFERRFPGTGGALYGPAVHGPMASFRRAAARSLMPGLYLAGGSTHPGAGVPMAALSGRMAANCLLDDWASTAPSRRAGMSGGISTR